jgi:hypothetical protein
LRPTGTSEKFGADNRYSTSTNRRHSTPGQCKSKPSTRGILEDLAVLDQERNKLCRLAHSIETGKIKIITDGYTKTISVRQNSELGTTNYSNTPVSTTPIKSLHIITHYPLFMLYIILLSKN